MRKRLCRSRLDKKIFGVCGGIAEYLGIDSAIVRIIAAVLVLGYGSGLLVYLAAALIMKYPDEA